MSVHWLCRFSSLPVTSNRYRFSPWSISGRPPLLHPVCSYRWVLSAAKHCGHKRDRYRATPTGALNHPFMLCTAELTSPSVQSDSKPQAYTQGHVLFLSVMHISSRTDRTQFKVCDVKCLPYFKIIFLLLSMSSTQTPVNIAVIILCNIIARKHYKPLNETNTM